MDSLDDYLEYALDVPEAQREQLFAAVERDDPEFGRRLRLAFRSAVKNPDFACEVVRREPPGPDVLRSLSLPVGDLERAVAWYLEAFRCRLQSRDETCAVLDFNGREVRLVQQRDVTRMTIVRADVAAMGPSRRRPDGVRSLQLVDPWGNAIEVVDR